MVIQDSFFTRDLVYAMNRTPRYWVLSLSEKPTRLYEATLDLLVEVKGEGFPMEHTGAGGATSLPGGNFRPICSSFGRLEGAGNGS